MDEVGLDCLVGCGRAFISDVTLEMVDGLCVSYLGDFSDGEAKGSAW